MMQKVFCFQCGARLVSQFLEGRQRQYCSGCEEIVYENPVPATAAVVFNERGEVLLVKRNTEPKSGQWCLPGGYLEIDETPEQGCLRELYEETGLEGEVAGMLGNVTGSSPFYRTVLLMGYRVRGVRGQLVAGDDCQEVHYFGIAEMPPLAFLSHRELLARALGRGSGRPEFQEDWGAYVITSGDHLELAEKACAGGARILQYRDKQASRRDLLNMARHLREITHRFGTLFIINDYIDIALLVGADGVHLGQEDIGVVEARRIVPSGFIIGVSTHSLAQAVEAEAQGADYIGSGPVFATPTKAHYVPIGLDTLTQVLETVRIPVVAIGGINLQNIAQVRARGAKNFAMVRAFQQDTEAVIQQVNHPSFS